MATPQGFWCTFPTNPFGDYKTFIKVSAKGSVSCSRKVKGWIGFACNSLKTAVNGI